MLQSIKRILKLKIDDHRVHFCVARFQHFVESNQGTMAEPVKQVIAEQAKEIFSIKSAKERNELFMQKNISSLDHRVVGKVLVNCFCMMRSNLLYSEAPITKPSKS